MTEDSEEAINSSIVGRKRLPSAPTYNTLRPRPQSTLELPVKCACSQANGCAALKYLNVQEGVQAACIAYDQRLSGRMNGLAAGRPVMCQN